MVFSGIIIEESLIDTHILKEVRVFDTTIQMVSKRHKTPWLNQWTLKHIEIMEEDADKMAEKISASLDPYHPWFAHFESSGLQYLIFRGKIFKLDRFSSHQYEAVVSYGLSIGIDPVFLRFPVSHLKEWEI